MLAQHLAHHVDVAVGMAGGVLAGVHVVVEGAQEGGVLVRRGVVVDVLHGIEAETVCPALYPAPGGIGHGQVGGRPVALGGGAVVEVGKPIGPEGGVVLPQGLVGEEDVPAVPLSSVKGWPRVSLPEAEGRPTWCRRPTTWCWCG